MRTLKVDEIAQVSGGEWQVTIDLHFVEVTFSGPETIQEIGGGIADIYSGGVDYMADFFTWWDPNNYYSSSCGGGGGW